MTGVQTCALPIFKANVLHEFGDGLKVDMTSDGGQTLRVERDIHDTWFEYGVGAAVQASDTCHFYFDVERTAGGDVKKEWQWNAGVRWEL